MIEYDCAKVLELADFYIDRELGSEEMAAVALHLGQCEGCSAVVAGRIALQERLRHAAREIRAPRDLASRVMPPKRQPSSKEIAHDGLPPRGGWGRVSDLFGTALRGLCAPWQWSALALAAAVVLAIGVGLAYRNGRDLSPTMRVGLQQHIHCAVDRTYGQLPVLDLQAKYAGILPVVAQCAEQYRSSGLRIVMAHECSFQGRPYVHVILRGGGHLASVLLTKRGSGEGFANDQMNSSTAQGFNIAAFQTPAWLVYMISNLDPSTNESMLEVMSPGLSKMPAHANVAAAQRLHNVFLILR
jgi:hypothetical protein